MKTRNKKEAKERRWVIFNNGCIHGVQHSELVVVRSIPHRSVIQNSVAVFTLSKTFSLIAALAAVTALVLLLAGCEPKNSSWFFTGAFTPRGGADYGRNSQKGPVSLQ